jgi:hypothetical protein
LSVTRTFVIVEEVDDVITGGDDLLLPPVFRFDLPKMLLAELLPLVVWSRDVLIDNGNILEYVSKFCELPLLALEIVVGDDILLVHTKLTPVTH